MGYILANLGHSSFHQRISKRNQSNGSIN